MRFQQLILQDLFAQTLLAKLNSGCLSPSDLHWPWCRREGGLLLKSSMDALLFAADRSAKLFVKEQQLPWPAPATALIACVLFPCAMALRALQVRWAGAGMQRTFFFCRLVFPCYVSGMHRNRGSVHWAFAHTSGHLSLDGMACAHDGSPLASARQWRLSA